MGLVVVAGAGTMLVTVLLVAWPAFHTQLIKLRPPISAKDHTSVDQAFGAAGLLALSVGEALIVVGLAHQVLSYARPFNSPRPPTP